MYTWFVDTGADVLRVRAVGRGSGALLWQRALPVIPNFEVGSILSVARDQVLVVRLAPGTGFQFETLDPSTGATVATVSEPAFLGPATVAINDDVIAYRAANVQSGTFDLVVRRRDTFEPLWKAPIPAFTLGSRDPVLIHGAQVYLHDGTTPAGVPVLHGFAVEGCGAAVCDPTWTAQVPGPETPFDTLDARLLAITDDGHLLIDRRSSNPAVTRDDLVTLRSDGSPDWDIPMTVVDGVAAAGDSVFAVGQDEATPLGSGTLFAHAGSSTWRADVPGLTGTPAAAGGLVYTRSNVAGGTGVAIFDAAGCGATTCSPLKVLDAVPGGAGTGGLSITEGTLFASVFGNPGAALLIAYAPAS